MNITGKDQESLMLDNARVEWHRVCFSWSFLECSGQQLA